MRPRLAGRTPTGKSRIRVGASHLPLDDADLPVALRLDMSTDTTHVDAVVAMFADEDDVGVDLVVMGSHGRPPMSRVLLGSVAEVVVRRVPVPVTVVR